MATADPTLAIEVADGERIRTMAEQAAIESRRLKLAHVRDKKIKPVRLVVDGLSSLVLLARRRPYTLPELSSEFPVAVSEVSPETWLVREPIVVAAGAKLTVLGDRVKELRLLSTAGRFTSIAGWRATIVIAGSPGRRLRVTTWDPVANGPDEETNDGRAYVIAKGGQFDAIDAEFSGLGFRIGESSGVAWRGWPGEPTRGNVIRSWFVKNYFGAYTFEATGMRWLGNVFAWNQVYGFDPHDHSEGFVVAGNVAMLNGSHGLIFSRGCIANLIRANTSFANGGGGIVLDDGRLVNDGDPRHAEVVPSSQNTIDGNVVWGNAVGIVLEGGSGNIIRNNLIAFDRVGMRIKNRATANSLTDNLVVGSPLMGIHVIAGSADNLVYGDLVVGGKVGISLSDGSGNRVLGNDVRAIAGRGIVLQGAVADTAVTDNAVTGHGTSAIDVTHASGYTGSMIVGNSTVDWVEPSPARIDSPTTFVHDHPAIGVWAVILLVPLVWWLPARRRRLFASRTGGATDRAA